MARFFSFLAVGILTLALVLAFGATGCGPAPSTGGGKMSGDKMDGGKMDGKMGGKMDGGKMDGGKTPDDKMDGGKMGKDK
jgi:hypothetical protein